MQRPVITAFCTWAAFSILFSSGAIAADFDKDYAEARELLAKGRRPEAGEKYRALEKNLADALQARPDDAHLNFLYGSIFMDGGDDEQAAKYLDKALKLDDKNIDHLAKRALLFEYAGKSKEAIALYQKAASLDAKNPDLLMSIARAQQHDKQYDAARETIRKLIAMDPKKAAYLSMIGDTWVAEGKAAEAQKVYEEVIKLDPRFIYAYLNIGQLHQLAGRYAESLEQYNKALEIDPGDWRAVAKTVQLNQSLGKIKERDAAREKLFTLFKDGKVDQPFYCREQYTHGKQKIMAYEHFKLEGEFAVRYAFRFLNDDGTSDKRVSLGSYDATTAIARSTGAIGKDDRMFHLDYYFPRGHATLGMFKKEPTYEETRTMVNKYLDGELEEKSSTIEGKVKMGAGEKP